MKKCFFILLCSLSGLIFAQTNRVINSAIQKVSIDSSLKYLRQLTGEEEFSFEQNARISSRYRTTSGNALAAQFLKNKLEQFGLKTYLQDFSNDGQNVYAVQLGTRYPNQKIIICAHYDNMPAVAVAAGADDNGSGAVAVLEAARILSNYKSDYTIIYALWDLEEQGLLGSNYFAKQANIKRDSINAVLNLDMISYDSNNDYAAEIAVRDYAGSVQLSQIPLEVNTNYLIGLNLKIVNPGTSSSDHLSFWVNNYSSICLIESLQDFNKYYHQVSDDLTKINKEYFYRMIRLAVGTLARIALPDIETHVSELLPISFSLSQNYPNPFNPSTRINYEIPFDGNVYLKISDPIGKEVHSLDGGIKSKGNHSLTINMEELGLSTGVYYYSLTFDGKLQVRKMMFLK